jgi:ATP-dependent Clp protease, protease subunit
MTTPMFGGTAYGQGSVPQSHSAGHGAPEGRAAASGSPEGRYILPSFEERTAYGYKRQDPYAKLFEDRIVFLGVQIDDASADDIMAQLLVLESQDPDRDIIMYINSPGGSFTAMTAIYDTMQYIRPQIQTVVLGQAASAAAVITAAGTPGKRLALPNARILIHQPALSGGDYGQASDIEIQANEVLRMRTWLEDTMAHHTGRTSEQVRTDIERDKILSSDAAKEYGLIDEVLASRKASLEQ